MWGWTKSKVSLWHENSNIKSQHLAPCKSLVTSETNWSHQTSVPSSSVVKICLSLIQKSQLMSLYILWFLIVPLCHILRVGLHSCLLWEIGMWDLCGFACWFALRICFCFLEPLAGRCCFHADQRATFSRQVSVSREKTNRLCLGQVLLTGETWNFETISRQRRGRGCRWKRGQKEHFVIQLQDMMSVLSGMPVLETHTERIVVYSTTNREIDQDNFEENSTGKSLLSVRTGLIHFFALFVTLFSRQLHFPIKFPSP